MTSSRYLWLSPTVLAIVLFAVSSLAERHPVWGADTDSADWPRFRGATGDGQATGAAPTHWNSESIKWKVDLPVTGHSSPIIWQDRIYLTGSSALGGTVTRHILCLDRASGELIWNEAVAKGPAERHHKMNSLATPSCATDGERVVAFFGVGGLHCLSRDGKRLWKADLGSFDGIWGVGGSPIIYRELVIQNCDAAGDSFLVAIHRTTGEEVWRTPRRAKPRGGWSTPLIIHTKEGDQLILNGEFGVQAYEPLSGKPTWFCKSFNGRGTPSPVFGHDLVYVVSGKPGDVYAVRPGGTGDITDQRMVWHTVRRGGRDLPSPILIGDHLCVISMSGIVTCYAADTGKELWKNRVGGNHSGSPVAAGGLLYACSEDGTVSVLRPGDKFELVAQNSVGASGETFRSSLAVSRGQLFLRSDKRLYCVE